MLEPFSYPGMYARTKLAVMDHNSGINRKQSRTKHGNLRYITLYSRVTSSWVAKKIMDKKDKTFIQDILEAIWVVGFDKDKLVTTNLKMPNPGKQLVIDSHTSRFLDKE